MLTRVVIVLTLLFAVVNNATAEPRIWWERDVKPATLKEAIAEEARRLGADNVGYRMQGDKNICAVMRQVGLACDYNTRVDLSMFLTVNGKGLFPWPEYPSYPDRYSGSVEQNIALRRAIERNKHLFKNGDLTVEAVKKWK